MMAMAMELMAATAAISTIETPPSLQVARRGPGDSAHLVEIR
jgi:hypothetical protein